jgi:hypothetical protein
MDENFSVRKVNNFRFLEVQSRIIVAQNGGDGRDLFQFQNDRGKADVARVQNMLRAREKSANFRVEKSVRVGNDSDSHKK